MIIDWLVRKIKLMNKPMLPIDEFATSRICRKFTFRSIINISFGKNTIWYCKINYFNKLFYIIEENDWILLCTYNIYDILFYHDSILDELHLIFTNSSSIAIKSKDRDLRNY